MYMSTPIYPPSFPPTDSTETMYNAATKLHIPQPERMRFLAIHPIRIPIDLPPLGQRSPIVFVAHHYVVCEVL